MAKMEILFNGFQELSEMIDKKGNDLKKAVDEALNETQKIVQNNTEQAASKYASKGGGKGYATGAMYRAILKNPKPEWSGNIAEVGVGFDLRGKGLKGYHSIFIMYGTPRIKKDTKLYNAIKGTKTRKEIAEKQEEVMTKYLSLGE